MRWAGFAVLLLSVASCRDDSDDGPAATLPPMAALYAPVFYHDVDDSKREAELPTRCDWDGDWISNNNWDNLDRFRDGDARFTPYAWTYASQVETATHWYLCYGVFHPQDWDDSIIRFFGSMQHENDFEGVQVVVRKSDGVVEFVSTEAHNDLIDARAADLTFDDAQRRHVRIYIEAKGHGVYPTHDALSAGSFPGGDGLIFRHTGTAEYAFDPALGRDTRDPAKRTVGYALRPLGELWAKRLEAAGDGRFWGGTMTYGGFRHSFPRAIGSILDGNDHGDDRATLPWQWDEDDGPVYRGDWLIDPAYAFKVRLGLGADHALEYVDNPFLGITP